MKKENAKLGQWIIQKKYGYDPHFIYELSDNYISIDDGKCPTYIYYSDLKKWKTIDLDQDNILPKNNTGVNIVDFDSAKKLLDKEIMIVQYTPYNNNLLGKKGRIVEVRSTNSFIIKIKRKKYQVGSADFIILKNN